MASLAQQIGGLRCPSLSTTHLTRKPSFSNNNINQTVKRIQTTKAAAVAGVVQNAQTRERMKLKEMFEEAYERCRTAPYEGVAFTIDDFHSAIEKFDYNSEIGSKVRGTVFNVDANGAYVDITAKSSAFLPVREASIHGIKHVEEAGIVPGMRDEFIIIGENEHDDSLILSSRQIQYDLAWERCRQLQAEDVVLKGKVVGANKGGVVAIVEGLRGFVPFSQISSTSNAEELLEQEIPLKFVEVDEEQSRLILSNRKARADSQAQLGIGSVVTGTVQSLKPYGAFIDIGGVNGLLHVSQISHDRVSDIATVLQPGDTLKMQPEAAFVTRDGTRLDKLSIAVFDDEDDEVMVLSHDRERGRVSLSTKKLEPTPGDMIRNPKLVFEKAEEMAMTFRQRIAQAEAMARADMLRFSPESGLTLNSDGTLGPLGADLPAEGLDLNEIPLAEGS